MIVENGQKMIQKSGARERYSLFGAASGPGGVVCGRLLLYAAGNTASAVRENSESSTHLCQSQTEAELSLALSVTNPMPSPCPHGKFLLAGKVWPFWAK
jgi:hypothetical protein